MIVSEEIYRSDFMASHPQIKMVMTVSRNIIKGISSHQGGTLPLGYLIGKTSEPLPGETIRFKCADYVVTPLNSALKYEFATPQDKAKYDKANLSKQILGKFIYGAQLSGSNLEKDTIASLGPGKICIIIHGVNIGEQKGTYISKTAKNNHEIGVFVE
jgi:hypothetical protein